jgi:hypothetical protein
MENDWEPLMVSATGILTPLLAAPVDVRVMLPLYVPGASTVIAAGFNNTPKLAGVTPSGEGVTINQLPPLEVFTDA